ncbi:hypothetical protein PPACK8108_LOCUS2558 [Phakopsora pachyrhizi]|uniref:Uncharacterized protein n=1 Tax=Phakopsora pachyrhizi TaxID=170000 RepID=A0AAV0AJR7_PHAPC|nr:hypothetical protein PPACK8108_LOCUS2558 [Phakopsora pachyrhizi]
MLKHSSSLGGKNRASTSSVEMWRSVGIAARRKHCWRISPNSLVATRAGVEGGIVNQGRVDTTDKSQGEESSSNASPGYLLEQMSHLTWVDTLLRQLTKRNSGVTQQAEERDVVDHQAYWAGSPLYVVDKSHPEKAIEEDDWHRTEESAGVCLGLSEETASQKIIRAIKFNLGSPSKRKDQISYQMDMSEEIQSEEQFQGLQDDIDQENDNGDKDLSEKEDRAIKTQDGLEGAELEDIQERDGKDGGGDGDNDEEDCDDNVEDGVGKVNPIDSGSWVCVWLMADESWHSQGTGQHKNKGFRGLRQDKDSTKIKGQKSRRYRIKRLRTIRKKSRAVEQDRKAENSGKESIGVKKSPTKARRAGDRQERRRTGGQGSQRHTHKSTSPDQVAEGDRVVGHRGAEVAGDPRCGLKEEPGTKG